MSATQTRANRSARRVPRLRDEDGIRFGLAHVGLIVAALVAAAAAMPRATSFALLTVTALAGGRGLTLPWRCGIALSAWAIWTGFLENTLGMLTFSGSDVVRMTAICTLAAIGTHLGRPRWDRLGP